MSTHSKSDERGNPLTRPKQKKIASQLQEYTLMRLPEDEGLFAVTRLTRPHEQFTLQPTHKELEAGKRLPSFERVIYLISPFINHLDESPTPSCNCPHWMTKKTRCIHLRKFFALNPDLDPGEEPPQPKAPLPGKDKKPLEPESTDNE